MCAVVKHYKKLSLGKHGWNISWVWISHLNLVSWQFFIYFFSSLNKKMHRCMFTAAQLGKLHKHAVNVIVNVWFPSVPVYSSGRRLRGWCALATKTLSSSQVLKPLVPALCLSVVVIYGLADRLRNFVSGIFIPQYHYPYAVALCFGQVGALLPGSFQFTLQSEWINQKRSSVCPPSAPVQKQPCLLWLSCCLHRALRVLTAGYLLMPQLHLPSQYLCSHMGKSHTATSVLALKTHV